MERYRFSYTFSRKLQSRLLHAPAMTQACNSSALDRLTPVQRFRQADASWFRRGQTTTLFSSFTEKEPVNGARGVIVSIDGSVLGRTVRKKQSGVLGRQWKLCSYETLLRSSVGALETRSDLRRVRVADGRARGGLELLWCADGGVEGC